MPAHQILAEAGKITLVTSACTHGELNGGPVELRQDILDQIEQLLDQDDLVPVNLPVSTARRARELIWALRVRGHGNALGNADAIHVASALDASARYFVTFDKGILRLAGAIRAVQIAVQVTTRIRDVAIVAGPVAATLTDPPATQVHLHLSPLTLPAWHRRHHRPAAQTPPARSSGTSTPRLRSQTLRHT